MRQNFDYTDKGGDIAGRITGCENILRYDHG